MIPSPRRGVVLVVAALLAFWGCGSEEGVVPGVPPFGLADAPEQRLRWEAEEQLEIDGDEVVVERYADVRLTLDRIDEGRQEAVLYLDRYYVRVSGTPDGGSQLALSEQGLATKTAGHGDQRLPPESPRPGGGTVGDLLSLPVAGVEVNAAGRAEGQGWNSSDPILAGVGLLDWLLVMLPIAPGATSSAWEGRRSLPPMGQYRLGIELPLRYERVGIADAGGQRIRSAGWVRRGTLEVSPGFRGEFSVEFRGETVLEASGRLAEGRIEASLKFDAESGEVIRSRHVAQVRCRDCASAESEPDGDVEEFLSP